MSNNNKLISIILPSLNYDIELRRCLDSIRIACGEMFEKVEIVLVVPNFSYELYCHLNNSDLNIISETRKGIYSAMNDGIRFSSGKYLYFIGKDDIMLPSFKEIINCLEGGSYSALFFDVFFGRDKVMSGNPNKYLLLKNNLCHQGIIYSREIFNELGLYNYKMRIQADHLLNIKLLWSKVYQSRIHYIQGSHVWYSASGYSSKNNDPLFWRLYPLILKKYVGIFFSFIVVLSRKFSIIKI